jgi:hypothetical protein
MVTVVAIAVKDPALLEDDVMKIETDKRCLNELRELESIRWPRLESKRR